MYRRCVKGAGFLLYTSRTLPLYHALRTNSNRWYQYRLFDFLVCKQKAKRPTSLRKKRTMKRPVQQPTPTQGYPLGLHSFVSYAWIWGLQIEPWRKQASCTQQPRLRRGRPPRFCILRPAEKRSVYRHPWDTETIETWEGLGHQMWEPPPCVTPAAKASHQSLSGLRCHRDVVGLLQAPRSRQVQHSSPRRDQGPRKLRNLRYGGNGSGVDGRRRRSAWGWGQGRRGGRQTSPGATDDRGWASSEQTRA